MNLFKVKSNCLDARTQYNPLNSMLDCILMHPIVLELRLKIDFLGQNVSGFSIFRSLGQRQASQTGTNTVPFMNKINHSTGQT